MELVMRDVNLSEISMLRNNYLKFTFLNSYDGNYDRTLICDQVLKCCMENEVSGTEEFAYFILDIYKKELTREELEESLTYYRYGYWIDTSEINNQYLLVMIGCDICIDIICGEITIIGEEL